MLNAGAAGSVTRLLPLGKNRTIIGSGRRADMTISGGLTRVQEKHATITFQNDLQKYVLNGDGEVRVNNRKVASRVLESGDVINVDGTTIVFDDGRV